MNRLIEKIIAIVVAIIVVIIVCAILMATITYKPKWEINKKDIKGIEWVDYSLDVSDDCMLNVGSVSVKIGQEINPEDYTLIEDLERDDTVAKHLLAQSKRYEILAVKSNEKWYIHALRTTNPGVSNPLGFEITDSRDNVKNKINIDNDRVINIRRGDVVIKLYFVADILCETYITYD